MPVPPGTRIGPYEVVAPLGAGGMGEVYRARDPRLGRDVAVKALPDALAADPERIARFEREARLLAALRHPHIAGIHGVEEAGGRRYLVLEYVPGETLAARLARGPVPVDEALALALEIAGALEAAHEAGIVHRDLKPGNVMITPEGDARVLDFGLAVAPAGPAPASQDLSRSPTLTRAATMPGVILGTAAYMSPEQARGRTVDRRADIWAFGCVLFECLTGRRAFEGETVSDTIASILKTEPDLGALPAGTPRRVRALLERCLRKDPRHRLRDIGDARLELEEVRAGGMGPEDAAPLPATAARRRGAWAAAAGLAALAALVTWLVKPAPRVPALRLLVQPPDSARFNMYGDDCGPLDMSPDGTRLVYSVLTGGESRLWVRRLDQLETRPLEGTEYAMDPFWSPDGRWIGFFRPNQLCRIPADGGPVVVVLTDGAIRTPKGGAWAPDGTILFTPNFVSDLYAVPASGGVARRLLARDTTLHSTYRWPRMLPDGRHFVFLASRHIDPTGAATGIYLSDLDGRRPRMLVRTSSSAIVADGDLLYLRDGVLSAQRLDVAGGRLKGDPIALTDQVEADPTTWHTLITGDGGHRLAYQRPAGDVGNRLRWVTIAGAPLGTTGPAVNYQNLRISRDGRRAVVEAQDGPSGDLWIHDLARGSRTRLTETPYNEVMPCWSPDGSRIACAAGEGGKLDLEILSADQVAPPRTVARRPGALIWPYDWSADGKWILAATGNYVTTPGGRLCVVAADGDGRVFPLPDTSLVRGARFSPDGRWIAYSTRVSGRPEVFVSRFTVPSAAPPPASGFQRQQVSTQGGDFPVWRPDGGAIYFEDPNGELVEVGVRAAEGHLETSAERPQFRLITRGGRSAYDILPDGSRFLYIEFGGGSTSPIVVATDWRDGIAGR